MGIVYAEKIRLKSGEYIEGKIIAKDQEGLTLEVEYGQIRILSSDLFPAERKRLLPVPEKQEKPELSQTIPLENLDIVVTQVSSQENVSKSAPEETEIFIEPTATTTSEAPVLAPDIDTDYLNSLALDTWRFIADCIYPDTGLPFDNSSKDDYTSVSNVGLYLACIQVAWKLGFITEDDAYQRAERTVKSIKEHSKWHGFPCSWIKVRSINATDKKVAVVDSGHLAAGLILTAQVFPKLEKTCQNLLEQMDWDVFYDTKTKWFKGGYDLNKKEYMSFFYNQLGSDARTASLIAVGSGKVPVDHWKALIRILESRYDLTYLGPGWKTGGLFLQFITGLFFDERWTLMGKSSANAAYAQIWHAHKKNYPLWGWSASLAPDGRYLGMNMLTDDVVTPHACVLALSYYPRQVIHALKTFEEEGARRPMQFKGEEMAYGFRDAMGMQKKDIPGKYLVLDQSMILISLGNYLKPGCIWDPVQNHPWIKKAYQVLDEFHIEDGDKENTKSIYENRDLDLSQLIPLDLGLKNPLMKPFYEPHMKSMDAYLAPKDMKMDGLLKEWKNASLVEFPHDSSLEFGLIQGPEDLDAKAWFLWDKEYLYFAIQVSDQDIMNSQKSDKIYKEDCIELFIDPEKNQLSWGSLHDFQIGFGPGSELIPNQIWSWFQKEDPSVHIHYQVRKQRPPKVSGYTIEAAIPWSYLKIEAKPGLSMGISPAVHDVDHDDFPETKLNWCFLEKEKYLGDLTLRGAEKSNE